jgi:aminoglycoside 6-adenylyltransferase
LNIYPIDKLEEREKDSLSLLLLDKDGVVEPFATPSEADYLPSPPTAKQFSDCCNEFWWVSPYVAKGLWREEIIYARHVLDRYARDQLMKMLTWYVGMKTGFSKNPGKFGKNFQKYLEPELWDVLLQTYPDAGYDPIWDALEVMGRLFRETAVQVAEFFDFEYPYGDDRRVSAHLEHVRTLPRDARSIY